MIGEQQFEARKVALSHACEGRFAWNDGATMIRDRVEVIADAQAFYDFLIGETDPTTAAPNVDECGPPMSPDAGWDEQANPRLGVISNAIGYAMFGGDGRPVRYTETIDTTDEENVLVRDIARRALAQIDEYDAKVQGGG